jgi:hypothetical protein
VRELLLRKASGFPQVTDPLAEDRAGIGHAGDRRRG